MKDFNDFKKFVNENGANIHSSIHQKVMKSADSNNFADEGEKHEFIRRAWVEIGVMEMLEHYHNWLNNQ